MSYDVFFFSCIGAHRDLHVLTHSFPTRRSSDLQGGLAAGDGHGRAPPVVTRGEVPLLVELAVVRQVGLRRHAEHLATVDDHRAVEHRSEEHTSELQSLMRISYAVFCLQNKNKDETVTSVIARNKWH